MERTIFDAPKTIAVLCTIQKEWTAGASAARYERMTRENALKWVHLQMAANVIEDTEMDGVSRAGVIAKEVHVYKGLPKLAHALEIPYTVSLKEKGEYPVLFSFEYDGYKFFQMEKDLSGATGEGEDK